MMYLLRQDLGSLYALMGENRDEYNQRLQGMFAQQEQAAYAGEDFTKIISGQFP